MSRKKKTAADENLEQVVEETKEEAVIEEKTDIEKPEASEEALVEPEVVQEQKENYKVLQQIELQSEKDKKKAEKQAIKDKKKAERAQAKFVKAHRKAIAKNPGTLTRYDTDPEKGLSQDIVDARVLDNLVNDAKNQATKSVFRIFFDNLVTFFNILTFVIAGFLISVQAWTDLTFLAIVILNTSIGIYQEVKAKKIIDRLSLMSAPTAIVIRDGVKHEIAVTDVVLDDLLVLENGKQICADSIVLDGIVEVNESLLTGESDAILKKPGDILYSGSFIVSGNCRAKVDKIGKDNYIERLANQAKQYNKPKSDLMLSLKRIILIMAFIIIPIGGFLFYIMYFLNGHEYVYSIRKTAGAMIGMIPSGLFLMTSIALFVGVIRLAQKNVLVQELYCIEMLARVNCICLDKTGTITDGTMSVKNVIDYHASYGLSTNNIVSAMLNALPDNNLTSQALKDRFGLAKRLKVISKIPFSSQRKFQAVSFDKFGTFALGAPEFVFKEKFNLIKNDVNKYAALGYRVLCLIHRDGDISNNELPNTEPEVVAMILIEDNIRPDAINTIKYFRESGVQVRVISGDNPITVSKISQRAGIENAEEYISLDGMSDADVIKAAEKYTVFGRVSPGQKKLLVRALKDLGLTVAMTGDGVNDILALKEADCSIAVASGSEAARNVSHLVLLDSNFDSMPKVVAEGRRVINNVTSVASLFLTKTIFSLLLAFQALQTGVYPISTNQLILIDTLSIGIPSLFLILEPNNNPVQGKFLYNVIKKALPGAITILIISMIVFALADTLSLDATSLSTIIVIAATHTCLMVLFKACKPFNTLRRCLCGGCYAIFIFCIFVLPQFLEFRPLTGFAEYYSSNIKTSTTAKYPSVEISQGNYYVIDGILTSYVKNTSSSSDYFTARYNQESDTYYYNINGVIQTNKEIVLPDVSFDAYGKIYLGGYVVSNLGYNELISFGSQDSSNYYILNNLITDENGYLFIRKAEQAELTKVMINLPLDKNNAYYGHYVNYGKNIEKQYQYRIMPNVEINSGSISIDGVSSIEVKDANGNRVTARFHCDNTPNFTSDAKITINPQNLELLISGSPIYYMVDNVKYNYKVKLPVVSTNGLAGENNVVYLNAVDTEFNVYEIFGKKDSTDEALFSLWTEDNTKITYDRDTNTTLVVYASGASSSDYKFVNVAEGFGSYLVDGVHVDTTDLVAIPNSSSYQLSHDSKLFPSSSSGVDDSRHGVSLNNSLLCPELETTVSGKYVIDGYYTNYDVGNDDLDPRMNADGYLVIGGVTTDYKFSNDDIIPASSGIVKELTVRSKIFLLMLCLLSSPVMKLLQGLVPWIRKQIELVQRLLTKF